MDILYWECSKGRYFAGLTQHRQSASDAETGTGLRGESSMTGPCQSDEGRIVALEKVPILNASRGPAAVDHQRERTCGARSYL